MKIKRIDVFAVSLPMVRPLKMSFEEVKSGENALVRVETDDGLAGWGGAAAAPTMTGETLAGMVAAIRYLAPRLEGMPLEDIAAVMARAGNYLYGNQAAKSVIEMALHDALGRAAGKPAYELLEPARARPVRVPILRMVGTGKGAAADVEDALRGKADGYTAFKIKVGVADPREDAARTRAICEALDGDGRFLVCADANQGWSVEQAIEYMRAVEGAPLAYFEQPVHGSDVEGMGRLVRAGRVPIGADEGLHSLEDLRRHHAVGVKGGSLKTIKLGGMRPVLEAARLCAELGMKVNLASKMAETGVSSACLLQLASAIAAEWGVGFSSQYLVDDILREPLAFANGHVAVPSGPGLGIEVDEAKVRRYARET